MTMEMLSTCREENLASFGSDASILEKTLAVTQLYDEFRRRIYSHSYRLLGNQQDADDITQEVFVSAYLTWDSLSDRDNLSGWLYRSEEHTSELQSRLHLVCRLLLEKKKRYIYIIIYSEETITDYIQIKYTRDSIKTLCIASTQLYVVTIYIHPYHSDASVLSSPQ